MTATRPNTSMVTGRDGGHWCGDGAGKGMAPAVSGMSRHPEPAPCESCKTSESTRHPRGARDNSAMARIGTFETRELPVVVGSRTFRLRCPRSIEELHDAERPAVPYWADLWPSALVLADELSGRSLTGVRVVELGCGLGLGAIVAALAGADALATDHDRDAVAFARDNGRR